MDVWASLGAGRLAEEGLTWTTARTFHRGRELFSYRLPDAGSALPPFVAQVTAGYAESRQVVEVFSANMVVSFNLTGNKANRRGLVCGQRP